MKIILARHGKPDMPVGTWIRPRQMREWIEKYDQADICLDDVPLATMAVAAASGIVVSSPVRRCQQSARRLAPKRAILTEPVFSEADLPYPSWRLPRLPLAVFGVAFRLAWFYGFAGNAESLAQATNRACIAGERLIELARENDSVFLMGHGVMTLLIARHLLARGWAGPARPLNRHWQFSIYHAPNR